MQKKLILFWRKMKRIKILKPLNKLIFMAASSNCFNIILDFMEVHIFRNNFQDTRQYFSSVKKEINHNCSMLSDERSKEIYKNLILYRMTHKRKYMKGIVDKNQYFDNSLIIWGDKESMVDGGAFDGDTLKQFRHIMEKRNIDWSAIAFEPDAYNYKMLEKTILSEPTYGERVELHNLGTWDKCTELHFESGMDDSSRVSEAGGTIVQVDTIDHIVGDRKVTLIKMDVEGAELNSLKGAKNVILRDHPRLAISIYHSDQDMVEIIDYLAKEYPFYKLYVRHYTPLFTDTLCYAIDLNFSMK